MRGSLKVRVHSEGIRPSEHEGKSQSEGAFRGYTTLGACAKASNQTYTSRVATLGAFRKPSNRTCISKVRDPRTTRDCLQVRAHSEGTRPSEHVGQPQSESAFRGYTTLGACEISSNRTCIPRVHDPRSIRGSLKPNVHSEATRLSEHAGLPENEGAF